MSQYSTLGANPEYKCVDHKQTKKEKEKKKKEVKKKEVKKEVKKEIIVETSEDKPRTLVKGEYQPKFDKMYEFEEIDGGEEEAEGEVPTEGEVEAPTEGESEPEIGCHMEGGKHYETSVPMEFEIIISTTTNKIVNGDFQPRFVVNDYLAKKAHALKILQQNQREGEVITNKMIEEMMNQLHLKVKGGHVVAIKNSSHVQMAARSNVLDNQSYSNNTLVGVSLPRTGDSWLNVNIPLNAHRVKGWSEKQDLICNKLKNLDVDSLDQAENSKMEMYHIPTDSDLYDAVVNTDLFKPESIKAFTHRTNPKLVKITRKEKDNVFSTLSKVRKELPLYKEAIFFDFFRPNPNDTKECERTLHRLCFNREDNKMDEFYFKSYMDDDCEVGFKIILDCQII
jgi:hypothetical protein